MPGEKGLFPEEVSRLVRSGLDREGEKGRSERLEKYLQVRQDLAREGKLEAVELPVLGNYVYEAKKVIDNMVVDRRFDEYSLSKESRRVIATQLVVLYTLLATDSLGQMYEREKARMAAEGKVVPEPGSEAEIEKKIGLAYGFVERIGRGLTGEDELGIEVEYPKRVKRMVEEVAKKREAGILKEGEGELAGYSAGELEMLQYLAEDDPVMVLLGGLGAFVSEAEVMGANEIKTEPGQWRQQIREIAAMVAIGELKGRQIGGRDTLNIHMTWPETRLAPENTEVMWIAPMMVAMGVDWPDTKKMMKMKGMAKMVKERQPRFLLVEKEVYYFPYHAVRRWDDMKNKTSGVETRSWLRVAIPTGEAGRAELLQIYRAVEWAEVCRQLLVARTKQGTEEDGQRNRIWEAMKKQFKHLLSEEGIRVPDEGEGEMYRDIGANSGPTTYEKMMHDLKMVRVVDPEKFERIRRATNKLRRETLKKMRGIKA